MVMTNIKNLFYKKKVKFKNETVKIITFKCTIVSKEISSRFCVFKIKHF